ncbi:MAG: FeoA family protein [Verrucomicrobiota bacterium]
MPPPKAISLATAKCGVRLRIIAIHSDCKECVRLRELGFSETSVVSKITEGAAIICSLYGTRLAIGRALGELILVEPVAA